MISESEMYQMNDGGEVFDAAARINRPKVYARIDAERQRQFDVYGHAGDMSRSYADWHAILVEEFIELEREVFPHPAAAADYQRVKNELTQVAAVAVAWLEQMVEWEDDGLTPEERQAFAEHEEVALGDRD